MKKFLIGVAGLLLAGALSVAQASSVVSTNSQGQVVTTTTDANGLITTVIAAPTTPAVDTRKVAPAQVWMDATQIAATTGTTAVAIWTNKLDYGVILVGVTNGVPTAWINLTGATGGWYRLSASQP